MNPINPYSIQSPPPFCQTIFPNLGNRNINLRDPHQFPLSEEQEFPKLDSSFQKTNSRGHKSCATIYPRARCVCVCVCQIVKLTI